MRARKSGSDLRAAPVPSCISRVSRTRPAFLRRFMRDRRDAPHASLLLLSKDALVTSDVER